MTLTTRGKRSVLALYSLLIIILVYRILTIDDECITQDLATYVASDYHYGTPEKKKRAIETIYQWRGGIKLKDDGTHEINFNCVQENKNPNE